MIVHFRPSKQMALLLIVAHGAVVPVLWLISAPCIAKLILSFLLLTSLYYYLNQFALLRFAQSIISLKLTAARHCELEMRDSSKLECRISGISFVSAYLTVLILKPNHHWTQRSVVIFDDSADAEEFRRLRIMLRWKWNQT